MELIRNEKVDVVIDLHEAELQYPVISTIVAHEKGLELATMTSMVLSDEGGLQDRHGIFAEEASWTVSP